MTMNRYSIVDDETHYLICRVDTNAKDIADHLVRKRKYKRVRVIDHQLQESSIVRHVKYEYFGDGIILSHNAILHIVAKYQLRPYNLSRRMILEMLAWDEANKTGPQFRSVLGRIKFEPYTSSSGIVGVDAGPLFNVPR
jgi:hypothetical protein